MDAPSSPTEKVYTFPTPTKRLLNKYVKDITEEFAREGFEWFLSIKADDTSYCEWCIIIEFKGKIEVAEEILGYKYNGVQVVYKKMDGRKKTFIKEGIEDVNEPFVEYVPPKKPRKKRMQKLANLIGGL